MVSRILQNLESHKSKFFYSFLVLFSAWAIFVRFYKITEIGLQGDDVFWYWDMASKWARGIFELGAGYRPIVLTTYSLGMKFFGINDYSIKVVNSLLCLASGVLLYFCSLLTTKNRFLSLISAVIYLSLPFVILESREELAHIPSTFYFLLSYLFFILYFNNRKQEEKLHASVFLSLSGLSLGFAAHSHPDLATLGLPYVLFIGFLNYKELRGKPNFAQQFKSQLIREAGLFSLSYFAVFLVFFASFGPLTALKSLLGGYKQQNTNLVKPSMMTSLLRYLEGFHLYIKGSLSSFGTLLFLTGIISTLFFKLKKIKFSPICYLAAIIPAFHILTCLYTVQRKFILRLLQPSVPLIILFSLFFTFKLMEHFKIKFAKIIIAALAAIILANVGFSFYNPELYKTKIYKNVYSVLKDSVDKDNKVLVTPSLFHWYRQGFKYDLYFGKNAVYLSDYRYGKWKFDQDIFTNFDKLISLNKISYLLLVTSDRNVRIGLQEHPDAKTFLRSIYGISNKDYTIDWEYSQLRKIIEHLNSELIFKSKSFEIYKLKKN